MTTPRRSSRARTSQPSPAILQHTNSSSSSNSMTRERSTRSNHKNPSPHGSSTQRSQSIEDVDKSDFRETRQRQRARGDEDNDLKIANGEDADVEEDEEEEEEEEEEVTRCLCGQQEYPGLPPSRREALGRNGARGAIKDENSLNLSADPSDLMSDDMGSMFIQCDSCKVWQHGGCVGIMDEAMSPDEYYCEECRKDLHRIKNEPNGQFSSTYLPVAPPPSSAATSRASSRDNSKRTKDQRPRQNDPNANPKRRSTMNSRDAAYDEEEQLRRAIEESKEDNKTSPVDDPAAQRPKRSRSDSEAHRQAAKRPRTSSPSPEINSKQSNPASPPASDDESKAKAITNGTRRQRAASRGQRDKDVKDPEDPESEQTDTTNRRKGRSDKRKGDGVDSDHEMESPTKPAANEPEPPQPSPETSVAAPEPAPPRPSTRKSGRPPARRGGRVGRNQYTRDRDVNGTDSNAGNSPRRGQSLDTGGDSPRVGSAGTPVNGTDTGRPSRPRYVNQRTTMNEMKRRVAAILEFISRMQVEMAVAGESTTPPGNGERPNGTTPRGAGEQSEGEPSNTVTAGSGQLPSDIISLPVQLLPTEKDFKDLSSVEMMDVLTRHLLKWQQEYGKFGER
ncbi:putative transcriptional regulator (Cti6) [Aspergillus rambellii]|uniref:Putative transcriptional regulator (Cti6) n=1 Tax=Aspergillus rambellii TaxID=308745 RepID=A0A0F8UNX6_9EURO|nr:putative transcriptional regulator (Cti6) [Aspergillus rambellii]